MDQHQPQEITENYANPKTCFFHVIFKAGALAFYILSALFVNNFVIIFVVTVLLAALDFWVVKNVSGRILVGMRWWNEIDDLGNSVWQHECLDGQSLAKMNKKDSWLFWWTLYLTAAAWIVLGIFSLIRLQADYLLVIGVCLSLSIANIIGFTKCNKGLDSTGMYFAGIFPAKPSDVNKYVIFVVTSYAKKNINDWTTTTLMSSSVTSTLRSAFGV